MIRSYLLSLLFCLACLFLLYTSTGGTPNRTNIHTGTHTQGKRNNTNNTSNNHNQLKSVRRLYYRVLFTCGVHVIVIIIIVFVIIVVMSFSFSCCFVVLFFVFCMVNNRQHFLPAIQSLVAVFGICVRECMGMCVWFYFFL